MLNCDWYGKLLFTKRGVIARSKATWQSPKVSGAVRTRNCPNIYEIATPVCALVRNDRKMVNNNLSEKGGLYGTEDRDHPGGAAVVFSQG